MDFGMLLTQSTAPIFKYIVWVLGKIMEGIFNLLYLIRIPNVGLSIILFTIVVNVCMIPLTYKQQKFSKLSMKMQPEMKAIQKKYEGKRDQASQIAMSTEMQEVYGKYGVSPTGSCLYLLIQLPIMFALYRVIYQIPAYVGKIGSMFKTLVNAIYLKGGDYGSFIINASREKLSSVYSAVAMYRKNINMNLDKGLIDVLNRTSSTDMQAISEHYRLGDITHNGKLIISQYGENGELINKGLIDTYNTFLGLNIANSPWSTMTAAFSSGKILLGIGALLIPLLAGFTQWLNVKISPQQQDNQNDSMASSMKMMNYLMPLMSVWFCFTLPAGMGLYWIAGAVVRGIIMVIMNKKIDKMDYEAFMEKNSKKNAKKMEKRKATQEKLNAYANMKTRNINSNSSSSGGNNGKSTPVSSYERRHSDIAKKANNTSTLDTPKTSGGGSMMSKANAVKNFNEKNNK